MTKRKTVAVAPRNTRAEARRLFPAWPRSMQAKWVVAKLRTRSGTWRFPIGSKAIEFDLPDFLRALPKDEAPLAIEKSVGDYVRATVRQLRGNK